jgi:hypothetical protein
LGFLFQNESYALILAKKKVWIHFWRFFTNSSGHPDSHRDQIAGCQMMFGNKWGWKWPKFFPIFFPNKQRSLKRLWPARIYENFMGKI